MPLVDVNQRPKRTSKPAPRSPAAASLQPLVDVFNRLGALGSWDGVGRKGDVSRGLDPQLKKIVLTLGGSTARSSLVFPKKGELGLKARFVYVQYARASPSKPCSIEIELTRRKTQDSCRVVEFKHPPRHVQGRGRGVKGPARGAFALDDVRRRSSQGCCDLFHKTDNQSPITVRKITIGGDVKGVWTSQKEFTDCPVDMRLKTRTPVEFLRFPEKDEGDEEPIVVEEPTPKRAPPPYAPKVLRNLSLRASLQCRLGYARAVAWASPTRCVYASGRSLASVDASTGAPISKPLQLNETCTARCHTEAITLVASSKTSWRRPNQKMKNVAWPSGSRDRGRTST